MQLNFAQSDKYIEISSGAGVMRKRTQSKPDLLNSPLNRWRNFTVLKVVIGLGDPTRANQTCEMHGMDTAGYGMHFPSKRRNREWF